MFDLDFHKFSVFGIVKMKISAASGSLFHDLDNKKIVICLAWKDQYNLWSGNKCKFLSESDYQRHLMKK